MINLYVKNNNNNLWAEISFLISIIDFVIIIHTRVVVRDLTEVKQVLTKKTLAYVIFIKSVVKIIPAL